jgi:hypothetical protein
MKKDKEALIYIGITLIVVFFNLIGIFGCDVLLHDDPGWYMDVLEGRFPKGLIRYSTLIAYKEWMAWNIMTYSPQLARGLYVLLLLAPISCCFYYLLHYKFGFSRLSALTASILPNILPYQWQIPAGINMSYTLWGLLFAVFSLIMGFHYLEKTTPRNWMRLLGAVLLYYIATQMTEQGVFLLPPLVVAFFGCTRWSKKHAWLISLFFITAAVKFIHIVTSPRRPIYIASIDEMLKRFGIYIKLSLPFPDIEPVFAVIFCLTIIGIGYILYIKRPGLYSQARIHNWYLYPFFICWYVSAIFIFLIVPIGYTPRYTHTASFGLNALLIFSLYVIFKKGFLKKYKFHIFVFIGIIIYSGTFRYLHLKKVYAPLNNTQKIIIRELNKRALPLNSQVVIVGVKEVWGGWKRASGYLKYALKRNDITGLIGSINSSEFYNFDNHFDPRIRKFKKRFEMTGLSIDKPVFLFLLLEKQQQLEQFEYALQWKGRTKNAPWTILKVDKKMGKILPFRSGIGMKEYLLTLEKLIKQGISQSDILWGGPPTKEQLERLGEL